MTTHERKPTRLTKALLETAKDMRQGGILGEAAYEKITMRHIGAQGLAQIAPLTAEDVKALRAEAHMSQAVLAQHLNVTVGYVSQLERGAKRPTGAALALLDIIRRKGIQAIL